LGDFETVGIPDLHDLPRYITAIVWLMWRPRRVVAMKRYDTPSWAWRSLNRLRIWARMDTSSAENRLVSTTTLGARERRARDRDPLGAGRPRLVREQVGRALRSPTARAGDTRLRHFGDGSDSLVTSGFDDDRADAHARVQRA